MFFFKNRFFNPFFKLKKPRATPGTSASTIIYLYMLAIASETAGPKNLVFGRLGNKAYVIYPSE